jgi:flagellar hook-length control protein FliK
MMAIETAPASSTQGAQASSASHVAKSRGKAPDAGGNSFLALLSSLDAQSADAALTALAADDCTPTGEAMKDDASDAGGLVADPASLLASVAGTIPGADAALVDAGDAAAAGSAHAVGKPGPHVANAAANAPTSTMASAATEASQEAGIDAQASESIAELVAGLKMPGADGDKSQNSTGAHTSTVRLAARADEVAPSTAKAAARAAQAFDPSRATATIGGLVRTTAGASVDPRDSKLASTLALAQSASPATATLQALQETRDAGLSDKGGDKPGSGNPSFLASGALASAERALGGAANVSGDVRFADVAAGQQLTPDELLAQQVSVWATGKTQAAELKLDGFGDQPIEISIALNGKEAEVAFRSDHALARDLLQSALPELREMLRNEGLVLSGMTVGTSDRGAAEAGGRQGGRESQSGAGSSGGRPEAAPASALPARTARPQGVVDVFA